MKIIMDGKVSLQTMSWYKQYLKIILTEGLLNMFGMWDWNQEKNGFVWKQTKSNYIDYNAFWVYSKTCFLWSLLSDWEKRASTDIYTNEMLQ